MKENPYYGTNYLYIQFLNELLIDEKKITIKVLSNLLKIKGEDKFLTEQKQKTESELAKCQVFVDKIKHFITSLSEKDKEALEFHSICILKDFRKILTKYKSKGVFNILMNILTMKFEYKI